MAGCNSGWSEEDLQAALMDPTHAVWSDAAPEVFEVHVETTKGDFRMELHRAWAPIGVDRLYNLVRTGYYDDSRFSRVRAGFIVQFGLAGEPAVTQVWYDTAIPDDPVVETNARGTFAFAMTGPDTRTTQIYINLDDDNVRLDEQGFAPLGRVISGMDVVDQLYAEYDEAAGGGMRGGRQGQVVAGGNAYLDAEFPNLDHLIRASIVDEQ
jgi:homoserine O-acetyltransferase